jgi:hypothetical protein
VPRLAGAWVIALDAAYALDRDADPAAAITEPLDSLVATGGFPGPWGAELSAVSRLTLARLREARGEIHAALAVVRARRSYDWQPHSMVMLSTFLREEGRLAALAGDREGAIRAYRHYLALRSDPEPSVLPAVADVRAELARLVAEGP